MRDMVMIHVKGSVQNLEWKWTDGRKESVTLPHVLMRSMCSYVL